MKVREPSDHLLSKTKRPDKTLAASRAGAQHAGAEQPQT